jgi:hypothetical protein
LEGDLGPLPSAHIFVGSKAPWWKITDSAPQHSEWKAGEDFNERFAEIKND